MFKIIKILIVDDEESIVTGIAQQLKEIAIKKNYHIKIYKKYSVHSAKVLIKKENIDIFFIDYDFKGGQDGYSLIEFLNQNYINKFIILITSKEDSILYSVIEACNKESKNNLCSFETKPLKPLKLSSIFLNFIDFLKNNIQEGSIDIFLSHTRDDKSTIAIPLYQHLSQYSYLKIWIDTNEIKESSGVVNKINDGLKKAKYAIIIMSRAYLNNTSWAKKELDVLTNKHISKKMPLFIIYHNIEQEEVLDENTLLGDTRPFYTKNNKLEKIAKEINDIIMENNKKV